MAICLFGSVVSGSAVCADAQRRYVRMRLLFYFRALSLCRMLRRVFALVGAEGARVLFLIQNTMKRREGLISRLFCCLKKYFPRSPPIRCTFSRARVIIVILFLTLWARSRGCEVIAGHPRRRAYSACRGAVLTRGRNKNFHQGDRHVRKGRGRIRRGTNSGARRA